MAKSFYSIWVLLLSIAASATDVPGGGGKEGQDLGDYVPSFYWVAVEERENAPKTKRLLDVKGAVLAQVTEKFYKAIRLEGTGKMLDGRIINFAAKIKHPDGSIEIRYRVAGPEAPFGYGLDDRILVPFRSIAVDPTLINIDSILYIPAAKGMPLPDGTIHDGYFNAIDIGAAIQQKRLDLFTSIGDQSDVFRRHGITHGRPLRIYLVRDGLGAPKEPEMPQEPQEPQEPKPEDPNQGRPGFLRSYYRT